MHFFKLTAFFLTAVAVNGLAMPQIDNVDDVDCPEDETSDRTIADVQEQCGNGQVVSCCNQAGVQNNAASLFGSLIDSSQCSPISINGVGGQVPFQQACGGNQAACCTGDSEGFFTASCTPINF